MANITVKLQTPEIYKAKADSLSVKVYSDGASVTPTAATYEIIDSSGASKQTSTGVAAVIATNTVSVALASTVFTVVEEACRIEWTLTISGTAQTFVSLFDVVEYKLFGAVLDSDLTAYFPNLADDRWSTQTTFDIQIAQANADVRQALKDKGLLPTRILDPEQIKQVVTFKALEIIFLGFIRQPGDKWDQLYKDFQGRYSAALDNVRPLYDADGDASPDARVQFGYVRLSR